MSAAAAGIVASTTRAPSRSSSADPGLGGVARLGLAAVAEIRRPPQQPDREPVETGLGHAAARRAPTRGARRRRPSAPSARRCRATGTSGKMPSSGSRPQRGFSPTVPQAADGQPDRAAGVGADPEVDEPGGERGGVAGRGAARRPARVERVVHRPVPRVRAEHAPRELGQVRLADDDRTGVEHALDDASRGASGRGRRRSRAVGRADAGRVDQVLDEQRATGERPVGGAAQRLVEPGDGGVDGRRRRSHPGAVAHGHQRHALDLDLRPRDHERRDLDERRRRPRLAEDLLPHRVDERPVVDVGQEDGHLDDVRERAPAGGEHGAHVLEHAARLRHDVVAADELAPLVDGDDARDEQEAARLDRVREVRDRLGLAGDAELTTHRLDPPSAVARRSACSRISVSVCRGVSASGSTRSSISGRPRPQASASSKPAAKSSVRSTTRRGRRRPARARRSPG